MLDLLYFVLILGILRFWLIDTRCESYLRSLGTQKSGFDSLNV